MTPLTEHPPEHQRHNPRALPKCGPICKVPVEILSEILRLVAPPRNRDDMKTLVKLTHVCQFWRSTLINNPQAWVTIFATVDDRRSFVEICLERSGSVPLEVTMDVYDGWRTYPSCTCEKDAQSRLNPNEVDPCEWHFVFESFAGPRHWKRIRTLNIFLSHATEVIGEHVTLALGGCRFFHLPPLQIVNLEWNDSCTPYADHLFSVSPFPPTLRSLSFEGPWYGKLPKVNNLTSLTLSSEEADAEDFRKFMLNNPSLETLSLEWVNFTGGSDGPPVNLSNLKSLYLITPHRILPTLIRVPALRRLSSLSLFTDFHPSGCRLHATGNSIEFTARVVNPPAFTKIWEDLTKGARPNFRQVRIEDPEKLLVNWGRDGITVFLGDVHTLEISKIRLRYPLADFLNILKSLGPQLKTIRFETPGETEPFRECEEYQTWGGGWWDAIEDLVVHRFENGRPFSSVERMVVSESERDNRQQELVWKWFYDDRCLDQYIRHG